MEFEEVIIGNARLIHGDCRDVLPNLAAGAIDSVIVDPPYSQRLHANNYSNAGVGGRKEIGYSFLSEDDIVFLCEQYCRVSSGWVVWMTDSDLALQIREGLSYNKRTTFAPLPFYQPGRSVRLSGDGPCSWTDWIVVARTKAQMKCGTLPGGYVAGPGWNDKQRMGGKPTKLMDALVSDYSRIGDVVLDSHMGAGTTGVSCVSMGRKFVGIEIDRYAFDLACIRIENAQRQAPLIPIARAEKPTQEAMVFGA